jgi:predicted nucleic acid-binding Zn finger protein
MAGHYIVEGKAGWYVVNGQCTCADFTNRTELIKSYCKHRLAGLLYAEQQAQAEIHKTPKVRNAKAKANGSSPDKELEEKITDLYS